MEKLMDLGNMIENSLGKLQENFLKTKVGEIVDNAINTGIKSVFPDLIENQVIDIKDAILQDGVKAGIDTAVDSMIDIGKSALGVVTGNFENISQIQLAVKKGGLIETVNSLIDTAIDFAKDNGIIDKSTAKILNQGKKTILKNITNNIEESLTNQIKATEKLDSYCSSWKNAYNDRDLTQMNKIYKNIEKQLKEIIPLENTLKKAREIENLQNLINNNGGDFDISIEKLELAKVL